MAPKSSRTTDDEVVRLRAERDTAFRQLAELRQSVHELALQVAGQNERLDQVLSIDNNASEREFQHHAKLRLQSRFAGSPEGAHRWAILLGVVRTAQKHEVDVLGYLTWMFERRGTHRQTFGLSAAELTPGAYRAQLAAAAARAVAAADRAA